MSPQLLRSWRRRHARELFLRRGTLWSAAQMDALCSSVRRDLESVFGPSKPMLAPLPTEFAIDEAFYSSASAPTDGVGALLVPPGKDPSDRGFGQFRAGGDA